MLPGTRKSLWKNHLRWVMVGASLLWIATILGCGESNRTGTLPATPSATLEQAAEAFSLYETLAYPSLAAAAEANSVYEVDEYLRQGVDINARDASGYAALHRVAKAGNIYMAEQLLARGASIDLPMGEANARRPIILAAQAGQREMVNFLRERGAFYSINDAVGVGDIESVSAFVEADPKSVNKESSSGRTSAMLAAQCNQIEVLQFLLTHGAELSADNEGKTALYYAVYLNHRDMAQYLLDIGTDPNAPMHQGDRVLHYEAARGDPNAMIAFLVERGADVDVRNDRGRTPLFEAVVNCRNEVVETLLKLGADINAEDGERRTALHVAAAASLEPMVTLLLDRGAAVAAKAIGGRTPLHDAVRVGSLPVIRLLLDHGASVMDRDWRGVTPLNLAAQLGTMATVRFLLDNGAELDSPSKEWTTALHGAAAQGQLEVIQYLLEKGADVNCANIRGQTPLFLALAHNHYSTAMALIEKGADVNAKTLAGDTPLFPAAEAPHEKSAELLIEHGAQVSVRDNRGREPIHAAAEYGCLATVCLLVEHGADVNGRGNDNNTPLFLAAPRGDLRMVEYLIEQGADIDARNMKGFSAIHEAARQGHWGTVQFLLRRGVDVNVTSDQGLTPLHMAASNGRSRMASLLIENGANVHVRTSEGRTPLDYAEESLDQMMADDSGGSPRAQRWRKEAYAEMAVVLRALAAQDIVAAATDGDIDRLRMLLDLYPLQVDGRKHNRTALQSAVVADNKPMVELLISRGADPTVADSQGRTAFDMAQAKGSTEIAAILGRYEKQAVQAFPLKPAEPDQIPMRPEFNERIFKRREYTMSAFSDIAKEVLGQSDQGTQVAEEPPAQVATETGEESAPETGAPVQHHPPESVPLSDPSTWSPRNDEDPAAAIMKALQESGAEPGPQQIPQAGAPAQHHPPESVPLSDPSTWTRRDDEDPAVAIMKALRESGAEPGPQQIPQAGAPAQHHPPESVPLSDPSTWTRRDDEDPAVAIMKALRESGAEPGPQQIPQAGAPAQHHPPESVPLSDPSTWTRRDDEDPAVAIMKALRESGAEPGPQQIPQAGAPAQHHPPESVPLSDPSAWTPRDDEDPAVAIMKALQESGAEPGPQQIPQAGAPAQHHPPESVPLSDPSTWSPRDDEDPAAAIMKAQQEFNATAADTESDKTKPASAPPQE